MKADTQTLLPPAPRTPTQARVWFRANGVTISDWCKTHGLDYQVVKDVLYGRSKGVRGKAHLAAVALQIKPDPSTSTEGE